MTTLEALRQAALKSGLTKAQLQRLSGLTFPVIDGILNGKDCRMSSYEALKSALESANIFKNRIGDVSGNSNVINQGNNNDSLCEKERIELTELRIKVENYAARIADKDALIAALNKHISDLKSKDE